MNLSLCLSPSAKEKRLVDKFFKFMFAFGKPNFRLFGQKLFLDFKNPYKILVFAEPERSEGEATIAENPNSEKWRYLLDKIRTYFEQNPDAEF
ncbi:MAG TPA: hypothetical protein PLY95_02925 [Candidatus Paceibacterota bacterium]|nr:hypothetical protein [Candidatus Paceibacterota bacterium]